MELTSLIRRKHLNTFYLKKKRKNFKRVFLKCRLFDLRREI